MFGEQSILTELEEHNILLNYSCRQGHCGSCVLELLAGDVLHEECLVPLAQGEILACQARPASDIKIGMCD
ncbi:Flavodoxin reductases (ferredoxin-NADPH reductases) family 1 [hydrothermal vent metagenome]|uniref:Flavodoxin reductases (Ferredoxin-NADPH reductases) family 1 n=1 Tax=hydrothermal vent metagenome TaxID=652676 RepID=A0A1W1DWB6_9ZZZZ